MKPAFLRPLGSTDLNVSAIGLGTVKIGRNQGVKYPTAFDLPDDKAVVELLACANDLGINLIDTAPAYGSSEERLGQLLQNRHDWIIVSKAGEEFEMRDGKPVSAFNFSKAHIRASVERSLKRLNTDYIDALLIHSDGNDMDIIEQHDVFHTLDQLKQEGKIRATGMSSKTVDGGLMTLKYADIAMVTYNLNYNDELPVIEFAAENNKGILIKKAFASGHVCANLNDPVQSSLDTIFSTAGVGAIIAGTLNLSHLRENVEKTKKALS